MFMDVLLLNIAILDKAGTYSSLIISNEKLNELETRINKNLTKLEAYMYLKLEELDSYLMNRDLEIVNYAKFTNIFKFSDDEDIYIDHNRVFEDLFLNDDFVNVCNDIATSKKIDKKVIEKNIKDGLLVVEKNKMFLTAKGMELSNSVMSDFILDKS